MSEIKVTKQELEGFLSLYDWYLNNGKIDKCIYGTNHPLYMQCLREKATMERTGQTSRYICLSTLEVNSVQSFICNLGYLLLTEMSIRKPGEWDYRLDEKILADVGTFASHCEKIDVIAEEYAGLKSILDINEMEIRIIDTERRQLANICTVIAAAYTSGEMKGYAAACERKFRLITKEKLSWTRDEWEQLCEIFKAFEEGLSTITQNVIMDLDYFERQWGKEQAIIEKMRKAGDMQNVR